MEAKLIGRWMILILVFANCSALAHDLGVARVQLEENADGRLVIEAKLPLSFEASQPVAPTQCEMAHQSNRRPPRVPAQIARWEFACKAPLIETDVLVFPWDRQGIFINANWRDGSSAGRFFDAENNRIVVPIGQLRSVMRSVGATAAHYLSLGIEHILLGWDHLAFVLALCLIAWGWRLVKLVTAFTVGHSLTLGLAMLDLVRIPIPPVEACIALSIAFVARGALRPQQHLRHGLGLTFAFGLLHGLGFASALADSGIGSDELLLGLFTFNLGVEIGQLLFVAAVVGLSWSWRQLQIAHRPRPVIAFGLGSLGLFWTFERIALFSF
ncbi:MAG: HupE/UreJ family protein [Candidatus Competibacteraceae bacterium]|jgi:hydrogenase/urease accessory protein HupE|nr:HupE/UreJ family protein [Candidatus Competibacteraceae bacterium]